MTDPVTGAFDGPPPDQGELFDAGARLGLQLNDRDNGRRLKAVIGHRMAYVPGWGWGVWDGKRLDFEAGDEMALRMAGTELPEAVLEEAAALSAQPVPKPQLDAWLAVNPGKSATNAETAIKGGGRKKYRDYALGCGNNGRAKAALEAARALFRVDIDDLDNDPWRLTCANGVLDLRALARPAPDAEEPEERIARIGAALGPFDPTMMGTRRPAAAFDPAADCPGFRRFIGLAQPIPASAAYLQRCLSTLLFGRNWLQVALVMLGEGGGGKSTTSNAIAQVFGGYFAKCQVEMFLAQKYASGGATPEEAVLPGARVYYAEEAEEGAILSSAKIKGFTGGTPRQSRANYGKPFVWTPHGVPLLSFNKMPRITDESEGMWRRLAPIRFVERLHELPASERVNPAAMERIIRAEASGILNWLLEGWIDLHERAGRDDAAMQGLDPPGDVLALKSQLRAMSDPVGEFLKDCTVRQRGGRIRAREIHTVYEKWCADNGAEPMGLRQFGRAMVAKDYLKRKIDSMCWIDLAWELRDDIDRWRDEISGRAEP
jgi:P4 family phage/plasmid primase-like protien